MGQYYPFFKAYDVRAKVPDELDAGLATLEHIGIIPMSRPSSNGVLIIVLNVAHNGLECWLDICCAPPRVQELRPAGVTTCCAAALINRSRRA